MRTYISYEDRRHRPLCIVAMSRHTPKWFSQAYNLTRRIACFCNLKILVAATRGLPQPKHPARGRSGRGR